MTAAADVNPGGQVRLTPEDIQAIDAVLIKDVIEDLTGCACLSGTIEVIWEQQFDTVIEVELGEAAPS